MPVWRFRVGVWGSLGTVLGSGVWAIESTLGFVLGLHALCSLYAHTHILGWVWQLGWPAVQFPAQRVVWVPVPFLSLQTTAAVTR